MQEVPADPVVLGVIVIHGAAVVAVQVPVPAVRMEPPPPSFENDRVGGSMVTWDQAGITPSRVARAIVGNVFKRFMRVGGLQEPLGRSWKVGLGGLILCDFARLGGDLVEQEYDSLSGCAFPSLGGSSYETARLLRVAGRINFKFTNRSHHFFRDSISLCGILGNKKVGIFAFTAYTAQTRL